ncbi:MAG: tRNA (adenosine(37)-N6)-threonylcarbamoyltransferase complex ATPase subunit type 1 TsaE [Treponema sp.]|nr:tRNA (adenosine(37)-N6)-threonylcarbamoyltransferase complex ATPase subunit type 1 TsaE [Treponema sp.]
MTKPEDSLIDVLTASAEETLVLGERIAGCLRPGAVLALRGGLGAGKTCLARGIARGLGVKENVTSPTYTIISEYSGFLPLYHIDAYRLDGDDDFENTGAGELISGGGVSVIEWSERLSSSLPGDAVVIDIEIKGPDSRVFHISGLDLDESSRD